MELILLVSGVATSALLGFFIASLPGIVTGMDDDPEL
jgi:hypothetical protein